MTALSPMRRRAVLLSIAAAAGALAGCDRVAAPAAFKGIDISGAEYARTLALKDANGTPRQLSDFKGKVVAVFFGYTQCPDVCPTTMAELAAAKKALGPQGDAVQAVFVTVDPERDTPEVLRAYVAGFDPGFVALAGTPDETKSVAKEFKVFYAKVPGKTPGSYTVDHTAGTYLFDKAGRVRVFVRHGAGAEALAADLKTLIELG